MKSKIIVLLLSVMFLMACSARDGSKPTAPDASPDSLPDLIGTYVVNGFDPLGTEYGGHLTILPGDTETETEYKLQWIIVGSIQEGAGVLKGNQLIVEWHSIDGMIETQGSAVLTVTQAGELYGSKTVESLDGEGSEIAFPND